MDKKADNIKNCIVNQLKQDGLSANGFISCTSGDSINQILDSVTIILTVFNYFKTEIKVFKNDLGTINILYRAINGVIESDDMIRLSNSLNSSKPNLIQYFQRIIMPSP